MMIVPIIVVIIGLFFTASSEFHRINSEVTGNQTAVIKLYNSVGILQNKVDNINYNVSRNYVTLKYFHSDMGIIKSDFREMEADILLNTKEISLVSGRTEIMENQINKLGEGYKTYCY